MEHVNVSAIIVTRGDVDLVHVLESLPPAWELLIWDNSKRDDLAVYGRYAAIAEARYELIYVQDDDCIISDPQAIVDAWIDASHVGVYWSEGESDIGDVVDDRHVVCNMPQEFRHDFYQDHALVGFGAAFHRDAPPKAFTYLYDSIPWVPENSFFNRTCDIVFTALTPRVLVDVPKTNLWWAEDETRMWRQPSHVEERTRMLELVRKVRDAG